MQVFHTHLTLHDERDDEGRPLDFHYFMDTGKPFNMARVREVQALEAAHPVRDGLRGYALHGDKIEAGLRRLEAEDGELENKCRNLNEAGYDNELFYTRGMHGGVSMSVELVEIR